MMALMCLTAFLPMYLQTVQHRSAVTAGLALTMMVLGWPVGATLSGRIYPLFGLRRIAIIGSLLIPIGASLFRRVDKDSPLWLPAAGSLIMGFGMGLLSVSCIVLVQETVDRSQRGSATASNVFSRNLGNTIGAALFGGVLNSALASAGFADVGSDRLRMLLEVGHKHRCRSRRGSIRGAASHLRCDDGRLPDDRSSRFPAARNGNRASIEGSQPRAGSRYQSGRSRAKLTASTSGWYYFLRLAPCLPASPSWTQWRPPAYRSCSPGLRCS